MSYTTHILVVNFIFTSVCLAFVVFTYVHVNVAVDEIKNWKDPMLEAASAVPGIEEEMKSVPSNLMSHLKNEIEDLKEYTKKDIEDLKEYTKSLTIDLTQNLTTCLAGINRKVLSEPQ